MSQRDGMRVERALGRLGPLAIRGSAFLLGGLLGAALVSMIAQPAAEALTAYLRDYLTAGQAGKVAVDVWPMLWEQGRFFVGVCVLGLTALGAAGIPVLFGARGFLFAFSVAGFCRAFGPAGLGPALFLFGLPAFLWGPILFLAGTQSMEGSIGLFRRAMGGGREPLPFGPLYWERLALWGLGLFLCVVLEFLAAPALLSASARFVL